MKTKHAWRWGCLAGCGLVLAGLTGCQTWVAGMTLPSGRYLEHPPQYFPPSPAFPLTREEAHMEEQYGGVAVPVPVPVPGPGLAAPGLPAPVPAPGPAAVPGPAPVPAPAPGGGPPPGM